MNELTKEAICNFPYLDPEVLFSLVGWWICWLVICLIDLLIVGCFYYTNNFQVGRTGTFTWKQIQPCGSQSYCAAEIPSSSRFPFECIYKAWVTVLQEGRSLKQTLGPKYTLLESSLHGMAFLAH